MKKKALKLLALFTALILILGLGWTANGLVGNPVSKYLAKNSAEQYLAENFPGTDYVFDSISYDFKSGAYYAEIKSPSSIDTHFTLSMDMAGRVCQDSFGQVEDKSTTAFRLDQEYRELTDKIFESPSFPYKGNIMYGILEIHPKESFLASDGPDDFGESDVPAYSLAQEDLELDRLYDIRKLGAQAGHLVVYTESNTVTAENAAKTILDIKQWMDDAGVPFYAMEFHLEEPSPEDGSPRDESIDVLNILYKDIRESRLVDRVKRADQEAKAYYMEAEEEKD